MSYPMGLNLLNQTSPVGDIKSLHAKIWQTCIIRILFSANGPDDSTCYLCCQLYHYIVYFCQATFPVAVSSGSDLVRVTKPSGIMDSPSPHLG